VTPTNTPEAARLAEEARRRADTARHELLIAIYERHDVAAAFFAFDPLAVGKDRDAARDALCAYDQALNMKIDNLMALSALAKQDAAPTSADRLDIGPWTVTETGNVISADFKHDVVLGISGDFADKAERMAYGRWLADTLNAAPTSAARDLRPLIEGLEANAADSDNEGFFGVANLMRDAAHTIRHLSAPASASTVPAGFWLAPMEPDDAMVNAWFDGSVIDRFRAMRDSYLARNPGACSVTDGEAKK
jgi:hypothetical protein